MKDAHGGGSGDAGSAPAPASSAGAAPGEGFPPRGRFVVIEGVEGAGKTTQVALLDEWLTARNVPHVVAREPGGTGVGEAIRGVLLHRDELTIPRESELFLMLAARAAFVQEVVAPALARGRWVVADRFEFSTFAYQGYGRGLDLDAVRSINRFATAGLRPDLVLVLDVPVERGEVRQASRGRGADRIEREGSAFLERVRSGYRALVAAEPSARLLDATGTIDAVHRAVTACVGQCFPETFNGRVG